MILQIILHIKFQIIAYKISVKLFITFNFVHNHELHLHL